MRRTRSPSWLIAALLLPAAACGSHPGSPPPAAPAPSTTAAAGPASPELAAKLNTAGFACTGYTPNPDLQLGREGGSCTHAAKRVAITTYTTADQQAAARKVIESSGMASGWSVSGDRWLVSGIADRAGADQAARILGGAVDNP